MEKPKPGRIVKIYLDKQLSTPRLSWEAPGYVFILSNYLDVRTPARLFPVDRSYFSPNSSNLDEPKATQVLYLFPLYKVRVPICLSLINHFRNQPEKPLIISFELLVYFFLRKLVFTMSDHWRTALNNWLQRRYGTTKDLSWERTKSGPLHAPVWTVVAYFGDVEYGRGASGTIGAAAEEAARQAVVILENELP